MADSAKSKDFHWICPEMRGQISIYDMHIPRRLKKNIRRMKINGEAYEIRINSDFCGVISACAEVTESRKETWINEQIKQAYCTLNEEGHAHSVECWQNNVMVGGLYGISIGGVFFGESMFSKVRDASKVALVHLVARLYHAGYKILDTQFTNEHLEQFGVYETPHEKYIKQLEAAIPLSCNFNVSDITEKKLIDNYLN